MNVDRVEACVRSLPFAASRRAALAAGLVGLLNQLGDNETEAKKKRKKRKKRKTSSTSPPCPSSPPPSPLPPVGPGACGYDGVSDGFAGSRRWAQTFLSPGSGPLTAAEIGLHVNPDNFSLVFEIRTVDEAGRTPRPWTS